jgi:hypothetical protein
LKTTYFLIILFISVSGKVVADSTNKGSYEVKVNVSNHIYTAILDGTNSATVDFGDCVFSKPCSNIFVAYQSSTHDSNTFPADKPIEFGSGSETNYDFVVLMLRPEYGYRLFAISEDNKKVQLTRTGEKYGKKFNDIKGFNKSVLDWTRVPGRYNPDNPCRTYARHDMPYISRIFPAPQDIFNFEKPGKYAMWIELQYFARPALPGSTNLNLIKFPPVKLTVIKKED